MTEHADAVTELAALIGDHGRAEVAYRQAVASTDTPARAWEPVLQTLARAYGLAAGLAAGHTTTPTDSDQGAMQPCQACHGHTAIRVYGQPWHYACWLSVGCPVSPAEESERPDNQSTEQPDPDSTEPRESVSAAETAADTTPGVDGREHPPEVHSEPHARRKKDREQATNEQHHHVDPAEERADFAREARRRFPDATDEDCAAALAAWHEHVRVLDREFQFQSSAGYSGVLLYELLAAAHGSMPQPEPLESETVHAITGAETTLHKYSFLDPDAAPHPGEVFTELDVTAQYLAAARSVEVGDGEPEVRTDTEELSRWLDTLQDRPGYLDLATAPDLSTLPGHARHALTELAEGRVWTVPTPVAKYLRKDHGIALDLARAVVWPKDRRGRRLETWARHVDTARRSLSEAAEAEQPGAAIALALVKSMYATFLGGLLRSQDHNDRGTYRPDWHDMMVSTAAINALRAWDRATRDGLGDGVRLVGGLKDAFWLVSPADQAPVRPAGLGYADQDGPDHRRPGKWHVNRQCTVTGDMAEAHTDGRVGTLQRLIVSGANAEETE